MGPRSDRLADEYLVLACRTGDEAAFRALVSRWQEPLWRHAFRVTGKEEEAWDVSQETWIAVAKGIRRLEEPGAFRSWLFTIATRRAADRARLERPMSSLEDSEEPAAVSQDEQPAGPVELLRMAMLQLSRERRALLAMRYVDGFELAEIARVLGTPVGTIKSRLHHARRELSEIVERLERRLT